MRLILILILLPFAAHAEDLWCMPDTVCHGAECHATTDEESSLRLHDPFGPAPMLRSHAEDIAMKLTHDTAELRQWQGRDEEGRDEILALRSSDMEFTYVFRDWRASGTCEVQ